MSPDLKHLWTDYRIGERPDFSKAEWDSGSERLIGLSFSQVIPILLEQSRFHPTYFEEPHWIRGYQGGIINTHFKVYKVNLHEETDQIRRTGSGKEEYWLPVEVGPDGQMDRSTNPLLHTREFKRGGFAVGFSSKVILNNLSNPGTYGGYGHFPLLDIVHLATNDNAAQLIQEVRSRCELERFLILRSSENGMMVVGVELVDEDHYRFLLNRSLQINHMEVKDEFWVDDRWISRSQENFIGVTGDRVNLQRVAGILRATSLPPIKKEEPKVIAASF